MWIDTSRLNFLTLNVETYLIKLYNIMMQQRRRHLSRLGLALPLALTLGLSGSSETPNPADPMPITAEERARYTEYFGAALRFWGERGVDISDTRLAFADGANRGFCTPFVSFGSADRSNYCPPTRTITITAATIHGDGANALDEAATVGHEVGHRIQDEQNNLARLNVVEMELGATCLGGEFVMGEYPVMVISGVVLNFALSGGGPNMTPFGGDGTHGTAEQQQAAFVHGMNTGDCSQYGS